MTTWKPGDVAHIEGLGMAMHRGHDEWTRLGSLVRNPTKVRPLAVIDPESAEDVLRLLRLYWGEDTSGDVANYPHYIRDMAAALREFAAPTPPKPPHCDASLSIGGFRYPCEGDAGHTCAHGNSVADAIWRTS